MMSNDSSSVREYMRRRFLIKTMKNERNRPTNVKYIVHNTSVPHGELAFFMNAVNGLFSIFMRNIATKNDVFKMLMLPVIIVLFIHWL